MVKTLKYNAEADIKLLGFSAYNQKWTIYETKHWLWVLMGVPRTLGTSMLRLKRDVNDLEFVTDDEWLDLLKIRKIAEKTLKQTFGCEVVNYLSLRNQYRIIHEHIVPRYFKNIEFNGETFFDDKSGTGNNSNAFHGTGYTIKDNTYTEETLIKIRDFLREKVGMAI